MWLASRCTPITNLQRALHALSCRGVSSAIKKYFSPFFSFNKCTQRAPTDPPWPCLLALVCVRSLLVCFLSCFWHRILFGVTAELHVTFRFFERAREWSNCKNSLFYVHVEIFAAESWKFETFVIGKNLVLKLRFVLYGKHMKRELQKCSSFEQPS